MKREDMTTAELLMEAVGIVCALIYVGLQIYYGVAYGVSGIQIMMNVVMLILVFAGLTLLQIYPERVNGLTREVCSGKVRRLTIHMVGLAKLIFEVSLLFTTICDVMGHQLNSGYSLVVVVLIVAVTLIYEYKIIKILKNNIKK